MSKIGPVFLTRRFPFSAAHRLYNPAWDDRRNEEVFGKCAAPGGHGHNYVLEVTLRGIPQPDTGMVMNLRDVKEIVRRHFWDLVDHRDWNHDIPLLRGRIRTTENIAIVAWDALALPLGGLLHRVRLWETDNNYVDYYGPNGDSGER